METNKFSRRNFLGTGLAAVASVTVGNTLASETGNPSVPTKKKNENPFNARTYGAMPTRSFGKTGFKVGILSLGGQATLEMPGTEEISEKIINRAIDLGVNYIDTAASYGKGQSQLNIGRVMKTRRSEVWLSTKTNDFSYDGAMRLLEESLKNLQTDHLDAWQLHNVQRQDQLEKIFAENGAIKAMEKAKAEGMVRNIGITGHFEPLVLLDALKRYPFDQILMAVNAADIHYLSFKNWLLPEAQKKGIAIIGMKVATRGRMLSSWTPPPIAEQPERLATSKPGTITIREALTYNMSLPVSTTIIGIDNIAQIEEDVKIASEFSPLTEDEMRAIEFKTLPIVRQGLYFRRWNLGE
ncbi:MAG TPA: aldo/keto reductase [Prolixibacteraceae bacterium]|nr:aldo/keto reductase [Prolixibacteraceae bacterium]